ncbi:MAG: hypothetical protein II865_02900 [Bacteroidales bacterium]|nr:hypothetical protein [Bacteroidales bacterium]
MQFKILFVFLQTENTNNSYYEFSKETVSMLELFALSPIIADQKITERMRLLADNPAITDILSQNDVDLSIVSERQLHLLAEEHATLVLPTRKGEKVSLCI